MSPAAIDNTLKGDMLPALRLLESVLRDGRPIAPEYPLIFGRGHAGQVVALSEGEDVVSACTVLPRDFVTPQATLRMGLIGSVATDPAFRRRGCASRVLAAAERALEAQGCVLSLLWADDPRWYLARGYHPVGCELDWGLPGALEERLPEPIGVRPAAQADRAAIHALYTEHPVRVDRGAHETAALLSCPSMDVLVRERDGAVVAYACRGRGQDLANTVHEWGGAAADVLPLLRAHMARSDGDVFLMAPPSAEELARALDELGCLPSAGVLGLAKVLDRGAVGSLLAGLVEPAGSVVIEEGADPRAPVVALVGRDGESEAELEDELLLGLLMPPFGVREDVQRVADRFGITLAGVPLDAFAWGLDSI
jgi:GNAT superfamily N-acetyltransferase